jgi:PUA domain protein
MRRHSLRKRDVKKLLERVRGEVPMLSLGENVGLEGWEVVELSSGRVYIKNGVSVLLEVEGRLLPSTFAAEAYDCPKFIVDEGAVRPILRGADVMAPGVRHVHGFVKPGDIVAVAEESRGRVIAVGVALMAGEEVLKAGRGKALKVLHRLGDEAWRIGAECSLRLARRATLKLK